MKILAFDTSSTACSIALQNGDEVQWVHQNAPMQQAKLILPMIHDLLAACSLSLDQLDAIAYGCGPGSFTGIRIANSVAQGIGFAAQKPIIQVSSLAALAQTAFQERKYPKILAAIDARMEQVYWGVYESTQEGNVALIGEELLCSPKEVSLPVKRDCSKDVKGNIRDCSAETPGDWYGVGDGWSKYTDDLTARLGLRPREIDASLLPTAKAVLQLARVKFDKSQWITAKDAFPFYLR